MKLEDPEMIKALEEDLRTFHVRVEKSSTWWCPGLQGTITSARKKVTSHPPVTLYVGDIPPGLNEQGLRHTFQPYGDLLSVNIIRVRERPKNFGFVTFCRRSSAASAIENVDRAGPLFLKVRFKVEEEEKVEREEMKCEASSFGTKWDFPELKKGTEKDFDEEIAEEERMLDEVDRFFQDESSEEWMEIANKATEEKEGKIASKQIGPCCARCSRAESSSKCSGCKEVNYCSVVCQRLDWTKHKAVCREKVQVKMDRSCQHNLEKLGVQSNGHKGDPLQPSCERKEGQLGKCRDTGIHNDESLDMVRSSVLPQSPASVQTSRSCIKSDTHFARSVPPSTATVMSHVVDSTSSQAARSRVPLEKKENNAENSLATSSGSASTGYFMQLEGRKLEEACLGLNPESSLEGLQGGRYPRYEANVEGAASSSNSEVESEAEEMTTMADYINVSVHIPPFSLEVDAQCIVELLAYDEDSRVAKIMSVEEGVAEALESLLKAGVPAGCGDLEKNPPKVGQLVTTLGPTGAYIRAEILRLDISTKQVLCDPLDIGGGVLTRHLKFVHQLPDTEVVPRLVQSVDVHQSARIGENCIGQRFLVRPLQPARHAALPIVELVQVYDQEENQVDRVSEEVTSCCSSSYSLASCLSLQVGRVQAVTVTHVESPREVYLCPDQRELERLQTHLFSTGQSLVFDPNYCPMVSSMVLACSPDDKYWYRALVEKVQPGGALVFCPDFGFRTSVTFREIRAINEKLAFAKQKFLSARCILSDWEYERSRDWSEREVRNLKKLLPVTANKVKVNILRRKEEGFIIMVNGVGKETLSGKTTAKAEGLDFGQEEKMELERLRLEVAQLRSSAHRRN